MGLYVVDGDGTLLVALGKVYDNSFTIHNIPYSDDVVRVNVVKILMGDTEVHFPTLEVRFVDQAIGTFIAWPTHLVRKVTNKVNFSPVNPFLSLVVTCTLIGMIINHVGFTEASPKAD